MTESSESQPRFDREAAFGRMQGFLAAFCVSPRPFQEEMLWGLMTDELRDLAVALVEVQARIDRALADGAAGEREAFLATRPPGLEELRFSSGVCGCMLLSMACRVNEQKLRELLWQLPSDRLDNLQRALAHLRPRIEECLATGRGGQRALYLASIEDKPNRPRRRLGGVVKLGPREREILLLFPNRTAKEIADALLLSESTVRSHIANIRSKFGPSNQKELILWLHGHDCLE